MSVQLPIALAIQVSADTLVTLQARTPVEVAADVALIVMALAVALSAAWAALFLRKRLTGVEHAVRSVGRDMAARAGPLVDRSRDVADNVEFITRALRTDVERLNASVRVLTERLHQASDRMEERIEEFNALIEVVQSEAEAIFIETASTVRGVTAGARSFPRASDTEGSSDQPVDPDGTPSPERSTGDIGAADPEHRREA